MACGEGVEMVALMAPGDFRTSSSLIVRPMLLSHLCLWNLPAGDSLGALAWKDAG